MTASPNDGRRDRRILRAREVDQDLHGARAVGVAPKVSAQLELVELVGDARQRGQPDRVADLAHARRVAAGVERNLDGFENRLLLVAQARASTGRRGARLRSIHGASPRSRSHPVDQMSVVAGCLLPSDNRNCIRLGAQKKHLFECVGEKLAVMFEYRVAFSNNRRYVRYKASHPVLGTPGRVSHRMREPAITTLLSKRATEKRGRAK